MLKFILNKDNLQTTLIFCFHLKKTTAESYWLLQEAYGDHASSQDLYEGWFQPVALAERQWLYVWWDWRGVVL